MNDKPKRHKGKWQHAHCTVAQLQNKNVVSQHLKKTINHQLHIDLWSNVPSWATF
jgi:hypothetical protein